jgi:hypothetical protein
MTKLEFFPQSHDAQFEKLKLASIPNETATQHRYGVEPAAIDLRNIPTIMSLILILVVFAVLANSALLAIDRKLHRSP